jgi:hypothetical protein
MGRPALVMAALAAAICPACLGGASQAPEARSGTVAGIVVAVAPSDGLLADNSAYDDLVRAPAAMVVVAGRTAQGRRVVRGIRSDLRGRFWVRLPVGTYTFELRVGSRLRTPVRVRAGRTARVRLTQYPPASGKRVTL